MFVMGRGGGTAGVCASELGLQPAEHSPSCENQDPPTQPTHPTNQPTIFHNQPQSAAAAAAYATCAQLRQWVDTASDSTYVLLHSRVEGRAGRCAGSNCRVRLCLCVGVVVDLRPTLFSSHPIPTTQPNRPRKTKRYVGALKALEKSEKAAEDDGKAPRKEAAEQRVELLEKLGWGHWAEYEKARLRVRFPGSYPLF
jgi:hypothetical protein